MTPVAAAARPAFRDKQTAYRADVDGLRAVAVIAVVLFHGFPWLLPGGFIGVDVFFVISGFLITRQIQVALEAGSFSVADFYYRRIQRIFPALLLVQGVTLVFGLVFLFSIELQALAKDLLASAAFGSNIYDWLSGGYFEQDSETRILLHLWSLGVEEQYYLVWPLVMALLWRRSQLLLAAVLVLTLLSLCLNLYVSPAHPNASFYLPPTRFWELAGGALTYLTSRPLPVRRRPGVRLARVLSVLGAVAIAGGLLFIDEQQNYPGWRALAPTLGTALIIVAGEKSWVNERLLAHPGMVSIGLVSYPLYLWHWPLIVFARLLDAGRSPTLMTMSAMAASLALATLTYLWIDRPLRLGKALLETRRRRAAALVTCMVIVAALSGWTVTRSGFPTRFPDADALQNEQREFKTTDACKRQFPASEFCLGPASLSSASIALLGDSHALHLYPGLAATLPDSDRGIVAIGAGNCPPLQDIDVRIEHIRKPCAALFDGVIDYVLRDSAIRTLIISSYAISTVSGGLDYRSGDHLRLLRAGVPVAESSESVYLAGLERLLDAAAVAQKHVVIVLDTPELDFDPLSCLPRPWVGTPRGSPCAVDRAKVEARQGALRQKIWRLTADHASAAVLDPLDVLCDSARCTAIHDGHLLYRDRDHLTEYGSKLLMDRLWNSGPSVLG